MVSRRVPLSCFPCSRVGGCAQGGHNHKRRTGRRRLCLAGMSSFRRGPRWIERSSKKEAGAMHLPPRTHWMGLTGASAPAPFGGVSEPEFRSELRAERLRYNHPVWCDEARGSPERVRGRIAVEVPHIAIKIVSEVGTVRQIEELAE